LEGGMRRLVLLAAVARSAAFVPSVYRAGSTFAAARAASAQTMQLGSGQETGRDSGDSIPLEHAARPTSAPLMQLESGQETERDGDDLSLLAQAARARRVVPAPRPAKRNIPFETARFSVQRIGLQSEDEWWAWCADLKPGITSKRFWHLPSRPDLAYPAEWQGWDDWLGVLLPFAEARAAVSRLGVLSQEHWWAVARERASLLQQLRVPARPHIYYAKEWRGYDDWLGKPETTLVMPRDYGKGRGLAD